ncbi:1573_t:CDS:2 [Diversispora eburnea]|uniref:1573_t:CDS:1 n=1 Tax=Diversispora eburnea TaxID=1213867 RepID=A0A9N8YM51_9GLOM|nr:1573_t:CDS:2 [Diversispora eburnea]
MENPSITFTASQSVDYLGQTHNWTDTDTVYSYKGICQELKECQEKIRKYEGNEKKANKSSDKNQLSLQQKKSALRAEEKRLIRMKNALWRRMGPAVGCVGKGNKLVSPRTLKW